jgi:hypothetical protein
MQLYIINEGFVEQQGDAMLVQVASCYVLIK